MKYAKLISIFLGVFITVLLFASIGIRSSDIPYVESWSSYSDVRVYTIEDNAKKDPVRPRRNLTIAETEKQRMIRTWIESTDVFRMCNKWSKQ